jgi:single-stranded-DNA-specific exonuclease
MAQMIAAPKWTLIPEPDPHFQASLAQQLALLGVSVHPLVLKHLASLGFSVPETIRFLEPKKEHCHSPWLLKGIQEAVELLEDAVVRGRRITVVGDYDVDGVGATQIAYKALERLGANADCYIPHRKHEGYGIRSSVVERLRDRGTEVILTVDNGIAAANAIALAKSYGMTVILTDHHTPPEVLPAADVIVNPHQPGCPYPFKGICGGVVAYKLVQALFEYMGLDPEEVEEFDETAALCTVADVMPLLDENRVFVVEGLKRMRENPSLGIAALLKCLGIDKRRVNEGDIGFYLAPCLNAPGRLDSAETALQLLLAETPLEAAVVANTCVAYNTRRQELVERALAEAQPLIRPQDGVQVLLLDAEEGITGVLAGQLKEALNAPAIVFTEAESSAGRKVLKGSGRSIPGFSLFDCLLEIYTQHPEWFVTWGGHAGAAGVSIYAEHLDAFREAVNRVFAAADIPEQAVFYLGEVEEHELDVLSRQFECLAPFGHGHPRPHLLLRAVVMDKQVFGQKQNHLRLYTEGGSELTMFRGAGVMVELGKPAEVFLTVGRTHFAGRDRLELLVSDIFQ